METTLIILAHPRLDKSHAHRRLMGFVEESESVRLHNLYAAYPDAKIDVLREQVLLSAYDRVVFQFPFYWYSTPALLKEWFDQVLEDGWAFGRGGEALKGKTARVVTTTGGAEHAYGPQGHNRYSVEEFLRPIEQTAVLCGMRWAPPMIFYGALNESGGARSGLLREYKSLVGSA